MKEIKLIFEDEDDEPEIIRCKDFIEIKKELREDALILEYEKINEDYTLAYITYQNFDVLKRGKFRDYHLDIYSSYCPKYCCEGFYKAIYLLGTDYRYDYTPLVILNEELDEFKERIEKLNKKYGKYEVKNEK